MGFCDFTTRGYFFGGSRLRRGSLLLGVLRFDMVEDAIQSRHDLVSSGLRLIRKEEMRKSERKGRGQTLSLYPVIALVLARSPSHLRQHQAVLIWDGPTAKGQSRLLIWTDILTLQTETRLGVLDRIFIFEKEVEICCKSSSTLWLARYVL